MVTTTRETERKFDAAEHDLLPIFSGMSEVDDQTGPEEQSLEAVYYGHPGPAAGPARRVHRAGEAADGAAALRLIRPWRPSGA